MTINSKTYNKIDYIKNIYNIDYISSCYKENSKYDIFFYLELTDKLPDLQNDYLEVSKYLIKNFNKNNIDELINFLYKRKDWQLLNFTQELFLENVGFLDNIYSILNNNLKLDKKILINTHYLYQLDINAESHKNIFDIIKKVFPNASKDLISKTISIMNTDYSFLLDCSIINSINLLNKILQSSEKTIEIIDHKNFHFFKKDNFKISLLNILPLIDSLSFSKKQVILLSLIESPYAEINLNDLLKEYYYVKNISKISLKKARINNFHDLHSYISFLYRKIASNGPNVEFNFSKMYNNINKLNNTKIDSETTIQLPKDKYELISWGEKLNNCLASYNDNILKQKCIIFGVFKNSKIKSVFEFNPVTFKIVQFVKANNEPVSMFMNSKVTSSINSIIRKNPISKLNFKYKSKFNFIVPETNTLTLKTFGFLKKDMVSNKRKIFPSSFLNHGLFSEAKPGLYLIKDCQNIFVNKIIDRFSIDKLKTQSISELTDFIHNNKNKSFYIKYNQIYTLSPEFKYKRTISIMDIVKLQSVAIQNNVCLIIYSKKISQFFKINSYLNLILDIKKLHTTDDYVYISSIPAACSTRELSFKFYETDFHS